MEVTDVSVVDDDLVANGNAVIKIFGVGGGGCNAVNRIMASGVSDAVQFIAANTDKQALSKSTAPIHLVLGKTTTKGLGAGGNPEIGEKAAIEEKEEIKQILEGANMVFITAGMGGGTGTGGAPVVAKIAKELGILTVAIVTTPFELEGRVKMKFALDGIEKLKGNVDTLIIVPNQNLFTNLDKKITMLEAFKAADDVLRQGIIGIANIITATGQINVDFADVSAIMRGKGEAIMGIGEGHGETKASDAITNALCNRILKNADISGATGILLGITAGEDLAMSEVEEILRIAHDASAEDVFFIYGMRLEESMKDKVIVTIIATGFKSESLAAPVEVQKSKMVNPNVIPLKEWDRMQNVNSVSRESKREYSNADIYSGRGDIEQPAIYRLRGKVPGIGKEE